MNGSRLRRVAAAILLLLVPPVLAACGKRGPPEVPEGRQSEFIYPRTYPDPDLVVPRTAGPVRFKEQPKPSRSIFDDDRTSTRVYGPKTPQ